ncbi:MAG: glycosyl hydrolase 53 family protein [Chitinophagaceae bacterium]|nr:glycosyl hydrolase 53 family protein [Chitinophagaceae bacterium]
MKAYILFITLSASGLFFTCKKKNDPAPNPTPPVITGFAKGADIGWLTEMEAAGRKFYNTNGVQYDCISLLKELGMNTIRLRVWVNPVNGWNGSADVINKAVRAKNAGMRVMIDFHYSDTWADPGHQAKPAAWASQDLATLKTSLYNHTLNVLTDLKNNGVTPEWVQVGNETNDGMLWPEGKASANMANFTQLVNAGYDAVKAVSTSIKVIVHVSNGFDNSLFRWLFDGLKNNGGKWDVIGMSLYPSPSNWSTLNSQCLTNMNDMISRYGKEVMVVEVGMSWDQPAACNSFIADIIAKTKSVANDKGLGVLYWEPEAYNNWQGYTLGAFDNAGKPTAALNAFN